jgi:hypothetical protein
VRFATKSQKWMYWKNEIDAKNQMGGHSFPTDVIFSRGLISSTCVRCGATVRSKYSKETGPDSVPGFVMKCDDELEMSIEAEMLEEVSK